MSKVPNKSFNARARRPSAEERALWNAVTRDVTPRITEPDGPLDGLGADSVSTQPAPIANPQGGERKRGQQITSPHIATDAPPPPREREMSHGTAPGLDTRTRLRMRRGQIDIERRMDLHGMTRNNAHAALSAFLATAHADGLRSVLVITGKGLTREGDIGVLRREVPRWLNQAPMRQWVKAFSHAAPRDGGEGALYVLLRRKR